MTQTLQIPTETELVARAHEIVPELKKLVGRQDEERTLDPAAIELIRDAGLFRVLQPRRWGGYEMDPTVAAEISFVLGQVDQSLAWVFGVFSVHNFQMALFPDQAAADVWGEDDSVLICSSFQPGGTATPVEGGYHFNGRWKFASGSDHAEWVFLGGQKDGDFLTCLVHKSEYELVDTWHTTGLRGTGSQDMIVNDIVVPEHRVHSAGDGFRCDSPGNKVNTSWLYKIPFHQVFIRGLSNSSLGGLEGMIAEFREYAKNRVSVVAGPAVDDPDVRLALGRAEHKVHQMKTELRANYAQLREYAEAGEVPPMDLRLLSKLGAASVPAQCLDVAKDLFEQTGGHGLFEQATGFGRRYRDLISAKQHAAAQDRLTARNYGAMRLGADANEWYL